MEYYRRTAHTRFDIKFHLVWITKYRKRLLRGDVGLRLRQIVRTICTELEVEILKGHISVDHVHLFVSCPPHVSASYLMQKTLSEIRVFYRLSGLFRFWARRLCNPQAASMAESEIPSLVFRKTSFTMRERFTPESTCST